jgi:hypothetical protein
MGSYAAVSAVIAQFKFVNKENNREKCALERK